MKYPYIGYNNESYVLFTTQNCGVVLKDVSVKRLSLKIGDFVDTEDGYTLITEELDIQHKIPYRWLMNRSGAISCLGHWATYPTNSQIIDVISKFNIKINNTVNVEGGQFVIEPSYDNYYKEFCKFTYPYIGRWNNPNNPAVINYVMMLKPNHGICIKSEDPNMIGFVPVGELNDIHVEQTNDPVSIRIIPQLTYKLWLINNLTCETSLVKEYIDHPSNSIVQNDTTNAMLDYIANNIVEFTNPQFLNIHISFKLQEKS